MAYPAPTNYLYSGLVQPMNDPNYSDYFMKPQALNSPTREEILARSKNIITPQQGITPGGMTPFQPGPGTGAWKGMDGMDKANVIGAGADLALNAYAMSQQGLNLGNAPGTSLDPYGKPVYNTGNFQNMASGAKPMGASVGEIGGAAAKGAMAGTRIAPGIGTAIGAVAGAGSALIGGFFRKGKQKREQRRALKQAATKQSQYNTGVSDFNQEQSAREQYRNRMDMTNRIYNLYSV